MEPTQAFDELVLRDFELWLEKDKGRIALTANERSHLRMILDPAYEIVSVDSLGVKKSKTEIKREQTKKWRARQNFALDNKDQVIRRLDDKFGSRTAACIWDTSSYIIERHRLLGHAGIKKTFESLQQYVWGIRRQDVEYLIRRCKVCCFKAKTNTKAPLTPIVATRVMERLQIDLIDMRHTPDGRFKWICHIKDHFSKFSALYACKSKQASEITDCVANFMMFCGEPEIF